MKNIIKIVLTVLLLVCLFRMPYGYYQFVRLATCVGLGYLGYISNMPWVRVSCIAVALLFNPVFKVYLDKQTWNVIDASIAGLLIAWTLFDLKNLKNRA